MRHVQLFTACQHKFTNKLLIRSTLGYHDEISGGMLSSGQTSKAKCGLRGYGDSRWHAACRIRTWTQPWVYLPSDTVLVDRCSCMYAHAHTHTHTHTKQLTSILAVFNGVSIQAGVSNGLRCLPFDGEAWVIHIIHRHGQRSTGRDYREFMRDCNDYTNTLHFTLWIQVGLLLIIFLMT